VTRSCRRPTSDDWRWPRDGCSGRDSATPAWATEGGLGINDPVVAVQAANEFCELLRIRQSGGRTAATKLLAAVKTFQAGEELAAKDAAEDFTVRRKDSVGGSSDGDRRESARGNGAVNVGMQKQVLSPGVQDADHADLGAQVFAIDGDLQQV